jgi:DNA-binding PadR family transcriptional regulator
MQTARPLSNSAVAILQAIAGGVRHGFDIIDATGLPSGTVYPALGKLEDAGLVSSRWEDPRIAQRDKRPPRRYYELRPAGEKALADAVRRLRALERPISGRLRPAKGQS